MSTNAAAKPLPSTCDRVPGTNSKKKNLQENGPQGMLRNEKETAEEEHGGLLEPRSVLSFELGWRSRILQNLSTIKDKV